ncbi:uncharacterized protein L199_004033 [Kwoniella botswanensis]|uniref:uncharacterized protein n=1 Tax=Kwoniella botswanensis TaxID=1268659 RepID=UPI00315DDD94
MWWPFQWLVIYVLGGLTFIPLVVVFAVVYVYKYGSVPIGDPDPFKVEKAELQGQEEKDEQIGKSKTLTSMGDKPISGWLTVRRQFKPLSAGAGSKNAIATGTSAESADEAEHGELEKEGEKRDTESIITSGSTTSTATTPSNNNPSTYSARIAQTYRSMVESRASRKEPVPQEFFFCVLKGSVLFLYEDESQSNCVAALGVDQYTVRIEREDGKRFKGKDAEMFSKRNAVVLRVAKGVEKKGLPLVSKDTQVGSEEGKERELENKPIFLFTKSNIKMEDWYLALLEASSQAAQAKTSEVFESRDMQALVDTIDTEPDPIPMRWFNAMLGRIFFSLCRTEALEQFIIAKMMKKLTRVNRPSFLGPIVVREVNVGTSPPFFSKPMLKDLTAEGTAAFEAHMQYRSHPSRPNSHVRITIATTATIPTGFKPYVVDLVLAVVVKSLEGNLVMQIKKPPSNRIWYGFTSMPKMDIEIIPVVSERKIQIGMVLKAIEKQLRDVIAESVVLPNMDDLAFFDTAKMSVRGGIFNESSKIKRGEETEQPETAVPVSESEIQTSNEDPASAVPSTSSLRKRNPLKSRTIDINELGQAEEAPQLGLPRTDTAPPTLSNGTTNRTAATVQATKKWFAQTGSARPPSLTAQTVTGGFKHSSDDNQLRQRSNSSEVQGTALSDPTLVDANFTNSPAIAAVQVSSSTAPLSEEEKRSLEAVQPSDSTPTPTPRGDINIRALQGEPRASDASVASTSSSSTGTIPSAAPHSSTASLISSLRARDKQAIQAQVGTARDSLKKWGVGLAAKRKAMKEGVQHREEHRPPALYRPPEEDFREDERSSASTSPNRSLQDRLNAAAHAGATSVPMTIPSRGRSASSSSRPSLFASPKSAASPASASPPKWSPPSSKPTTGVVRDDISQISNPSTSVPSHTRRTSNTAPVFVQPTSGRSMVVPRVPKRPGQVTGIGHNAAEPMIRKVSTEDGLREKRVEDVHAEESRAPPALPPRKSKESSRPTQDSAVGDSNSPDIPSPAKPSTPAPSDVPPPLPPRKSSPAASSTNVNTKSGLPQQPDHVSQINDTPPQASRPELAERSISIAALPSIDTTDPQFNEIPNIDITSPRTVEIESALSKSPGTTSTAENALRSLVAKNEEALKAKTIKSVPPSPNPDISTTHTIANDHASGVAEDDGITNAQNDGIQAVESKD